LVSELRDAEAADGRRQARILRGEWLPFGSQDLRARANDDSVRLGISAVTGVARRVENVGTVLVVQNRGAAIVAAVRIGFREVKFSTLVYFRDHAKIAQGDGVGRIDDGRCVGI
jgi:hypothetical protein